MREEAWLLVLIIVSALSLAFLMPLATIWSLNTVFGLEIAYSVKTWLAIAWLLTIFHGIKYHEKRNRS